MATSNTKSARIGHAIGRLFSSLLIAEAACWGFVCKIGVPAPLIGGFKWATRALCIGLVAYASLYLLLPVLLAVCLGLAFSRLPAGTTELFSSHVYRDGAEGYGYYCEVSGRRIY